MTSIFAISLPRPSPLHPHPCGILHTPLYFTTRNQTDLVFPTPFHFQVKLYLATVQYTLLTSLLQLMHTNYDTNCIAYSEFIDIQMSTHKQFMSYNIEILQPYIFFILYFQLFLSMDGNCHPVNMRRELLFSKGIKTYCQQILQFLVK